jgi:hypothetical protein
MDVVDGSFFDKGRTRIHIRSELVILYGRSTIIELKASALGWYRA